MAWKCLATALSIFAAIAVNGDLSGEDNVHAFVDSINNKQSSWTAVKRDVTNLKKQLLQNRVNTDIHAAAMVEPTINAEEVTAVSGRSMPENYDTSVQFSQCNIRKVKHQYQCGCCWAVTAAAVMQDRLCILSGGKINVELSAAHLVSCCKECAIGCTGGSPVYAFGFMMREGIVTGGEYNSKVGCYPFPLCPYCESPGYQGFQCPKRACPNDYYYGTMDTERYYAEQVRLLRYGGEAAIKQELFTNGPVVVSVDVYEDFMYYSKGIYRHTEGNFISEHAVRLIGYGTENGVDYWIGMNSWSNWGEDDKGSFRILRGVNESAVERTGMGVIPQIPGQGY